MGVNLKDDFIPNTPILSAEVNQNFTRIENWNAKENLSAQIDGVKVQFTLANNYVPGSLDVFVDGLLATFDEDIQEDGTNKFTTLFADPLEVGAKLIAKYRILY